MKLFLAEHPSSSQVPTPPGVGPPVSNPNVTSITLLVGQTYNLNNLFTSPSGAILSFLADPATPLGQTADLNANQVTHEILTADNAGAITVRFIADDGLTPATTAMASFITSAVFPTFSTTAMKFGQRVSPFVMNPTDKVLYGGLGGEAAYGPRSSSVLGGTPVLFTFDGSSRALGVAKGYPLTSAGFQPSFPDGVGIGVNASPQPNPTEIMIYPGATVATASTYGAWLGSTTPVTSKIMRYKAGSSWSAGDSTAPTFPIPLYSMAFRNTNGHDTFMCVALVAGALNFQEYDVNSGVMASTAVPTAGFTTLDVLTNQVWSGYRQAVLCYDWQAGRIISVTDTPSASAVMNVPALTNRTDAFAISYDQVEDRLLLFYSFGVYVAELWSNTLTLLGSLPGSESGLYTAFWDPKTRHHFVTGAAGGTPNIYDYTTPATLDAVIPQGQWNDGGLGATGLYFNHAYLWTWLNTDGRGDYAGVNGVQYPGVDTAFSTLASVALGWVSLNATALLSYWLNTANAGALIRGSGTYRFQQRLNTDPTVRPYLSVVTTTGTVVCPCTQSTWLGTGSNNTTSQTSSGYLTVNGNSILLMFDLSLLAGKSITSATINMYAFSGSGSGTLQLWRCAPPTVREAGSYGTTLTLPSISDGYIFDEGITNNSAVVTASDFSAGWQTRIGGSSLTIVDTAADSTLGDMVAGTVEFAPYSLSAGSQVTKFSSFGRTDLDEAWFRVVVNYQDSWGSAVQNGSGGKMGLGWDFRMASDCGNGGSGSTGLAEYTTEHGLTVDTDTGFITTTSTSSLVDGVDKCKFIRFTPPTGLIEGQEYFVRNPSLVSGTTWTFQVSLTAGGAIIVPSSQDSGTNKIVFSPYTGFQYCGGSARTNYTGAVPTDAWKHFITPYRYTYFAGTIGTGVQLAFGDPTNGFPVFKKNKNYQVEGHIKMNSVAAPFDSLNNGVGVADGVLELAADGRLFYSASNLIMRLNVGEKVNGFWWDYTHGGSQATQARHAVKVNAFVLATSRVGLVRTV